MIPADAGLAVVAFWVTAEYPSAVVGAVVAGVEGAPVGVGTASIWTVRVLSQIAVVVVVVTVVVAVMVYGTAYVYWIVFSAGSAQAAEAAAAEEVLTTRAGAVQGRVVGEAGLVVRWCQA